jgi:hypothetical protein
MASVVITMMKEFKQHECDMTPFLQSFILGKVSRGKPAEAATTRKFNFQIRVMFVLGRTVRKSD